MGRNMRGQDYIIKFHQGVQGGLDRFDKNVDSLIGI